MCFVPFPQDVVLHSVDLLFGGVHYVDLPAM